METVWLAWVFVVVIVVGCLGNLLSLYVFSRPHMRTASISVFLCALSFVDLVLLILAVPTFVAPYEQFWEYGRLDTRRSTFLAHVWKFVYPVNLTMQTCSVYVMVMITLERWTAVCRPLQVRACYTPRKSAFILLIIFTSACAYNFIRFFEYRLKHTKNFAYVTTWLRDSEKYWWYYVGYYTVLYNLTHFLIPFSIIAVANVQIIVVLYRSSQTRHKLTGQQQREHSTTLMLLCVTMVFVSCNTLPFILNIVEGVFPNVFVSSGEDDILIANTMIDISNLLVVLNSTSTFVIYLFFSRKYCQTVTGLFNLKQQRPLRYSFMT
ncbi:unnamed protein product [Caenorhabditis auriculariae]|uniref:G-protein coupled receptors family 1 profile domain-containing protein n=1 Tax=Caenorhabditis auriculariae TaxID=2777116 RepID=A0A8S1HMU2_9PELO|nr:unnamed protein product [Caenorhabditis auriculariae]